MNAPTKPWFVYLVRAANGALYCGISDDPQRRFAMHRSGRGARFFHTSPAQALVYVEACADKGAALRRERAVKRLSKPAKEVLVAGMGTTEDAQALRKTDSMEDPGMHELILHHYPNSPFAEKARLMLGFKQLSWRSVSIPPVMPKPDLTALTGGYRRTPVLQVGADIYCDTALIARRLEAEKATPPLYPEGLEFIVSGFAAWADRELFQHAVSLAFQDEALAQRFAGLPAEALQGFLADRAALFSGGTLSRLPLVQARQQWPTLMARLQEQLGREIGDFLFGEASLADFAVAHPLWFLCAVPATAGLVDAYPAVSAWLGRVRGFGHGSHDELPALEAIEIARAATPAPLPEGEGRALEGFEPGQRVLVAATDYGVDPVHGELVHAGVEALILRREDPRAGVVHVHLPRLGYRIEAA